MPNVSVPYPVESDHYAKRPTDGNLWSVSMNVYKPAPTGAGSPLPAEFKLAYVREGDQLSWLVTVPSGAGDEYVICTPGKLNSLVDDPIVKETWNAPSPTNGGPGEEIPQNQTPVPEQRTTRLAYRQGEGLTSEETRDVSVGEPQLFSIDFARDLPTGNIIKKIVAVAQDATGQPGGVTITVAGLDRTAVKLFLTGTALGLVRVTCQVQYLGSESNADARVWYNVVDQAAMP